MPLEPASEWTPCGAEAPVDSLHRCPMLADHEPPHLFWAQVPHFPHGGGDDVWGIQVYSEEDGRLISEAMLDVAGESTEEDVGAMLELMMASRRRGLEP